MNRRIAARFGSVATTQGVVGLLAVLVLNMVVLPCAMAFGLDDHDCPHCPPAEQHEMAGHHDHESAVKSPCAEVQSQCCELAEASVDTRGGKFKVRDGADLEVVPVAAVATTPVLSVAHVEPRPRPPDPRAAFPPRHKLFCVYLD